MVVNAQATTAMPPGTTINLPDGCWEELVKTGAAELVETKAVGSGNGALVVPNKK